MVSDEVKELNLSNLIMQHRKKNKNKEEDNNFLIRGKATHCLAIKTVYDSKGWTEHPSNLLRIL